MREIIKHKGAKVKLSESDITDILNFLTLGESTDVLAKQYGVQKVMIDNVLNGRGRFKFLLATPRYENMLTARKSYLEENKLVEHKRKKSSCVKLSDLDLNTLKNIQKDYKSMTVKMLAEKYNVAATSVYEFLKGRTTPKLTSHLKKIGFYEDVSKLEAPSDIDTVAVFDTDKDIKEESSNKITEKPTTDVAKSLFQKVCENNCVFGNRILGYVEESSNFNKSELYSSNVVTIIVMNAVCRLEPYELKMYLTQLGELK